MRTSSRRFRRVSLGLVALTGLVLTASVNAGPLEDFSGYTRIGYPPTDPKAGPKGGDKGDPKVKPAVDPKGDPKVRPAAGRDAKAIGVTVYYMVLDRKGGKASSRVANDTFGIGIKDFDAMFVSGKNSDRDKLDTGARYLYLYQVVNDSGRPAAVRDVSVRLIVDPRLITSWGHFAEKKKADKGLVVGRGLGFAMPFEGKGADKNPIRAVSTDFPGIDAAHKEYLSPAPAVRAPKPYDIVPIALGNVPAAAGEDPGKEPEAVLIVPNAEFNTDVADVNATYLKPAMLSDTDSLPGVDDPATRARMRDQWRKRWPAVRAYWRDEPLAPKQRSTIFGFTCDFPPVLDETSVHGKSLGVGFGKGPGGVTPESALALSIGTARDREQRLADGKATRSATDAGGDQLVALGVSFDLGRVRGQNAAGALPLVSGTLPTPTPPARASPAGGDVGGAFGSVPIAPGGGGGGFPGGLGGLGGVPGGLGGGVGGVGGGGAIPTPPAPIFAPLSTGGGGTGGGNGGGNGGGTGNGTNGNGTNGTNGANGAGTGTGTGNGNGNGTGNANSTTGNMATTNGNSQSQTQSQTVNVVINNNNTLTNTNNNNNSNTNTNTNNNSNTNVNNNRNSNRNTNVNSNCCGNVPNGTVVPAPPAWLLGILGMPVFAFLARRRQKPTLESGLEGAAD